MVSEEHRNLILAVVLSVVILLGYQFVFEQPQIEQEQAARQQAAQQEQQVGGAPATVPEAGPRGVPQVGAPPAVPSAVPQATPTTPSRETVVGQAPRVTLNSKRLHGSISLKGARIDDLTLADYRETIEPGSPEITLLSPTGAPKPYFAQFGWASATPNVPVPGPNTVWRASAGTVTPDRPVTLSWNNGQGLVFQQVIAIDENYMFTVTQRVTNSAGRPVVLHPFGLVSRTGTPEVTRFFILHEGLLGVLDGRLNEIDYDDLQDEERGSIDSACSQDPRFASLPASQHRPEKGTREKCSSGGWIGFTDKYWLTALVPDQRLATGVRFKHWLEDQTDKYQVDFLGAPVTVPPGGFAESSNRLFAGAKEVKLLDSYEEKLGIKRFDMAVDWGWLHFLTRPIFSALHYFNDHITHNFGLAILLLTVLIKLAFFPLANKSYKAMSRLKKLQPKMVEIREAYKDDRARQNQEMMALYKNENANPMAGCFPILIQIPVFFALYKVLFVTIEMRHTPFYGWIKDLSAPDPLGILTVFGLVQWDIPEVLDIVNIGIWPIIMGVTMFLQQKLNPQPADPTQAKIFMLLPIVFTFLLGQFPAGLVIYWAWNNLLSIAQQWVIMKRMGVSVSGQTTPTGPPAGATGGGPAKPSRTAQGPRQDKGGSASQPAQGRSDRPARRRGNKRRRSRKSASR